MPLEVGGRGKIGDEGCEMWDFALVHYASLSLGMEQPSRTSPGLCAGQAGQVEHREKRKDRRKEWLSKVRIMWPDHGP